VSLYVVDPAPTTTTSVKGPEELGARSILNPVSLSELSFQEREMLLLLAGDVAIRPDGAIGTVVAGGKVVAVTGPT
jgi:hypothetical protein